MDSENDKPLLEKSPSIDDNKAKTENNDDNEQQPDVVDRDLPENHGNDSPSSPKSPSEGDPKPEIDDESEIKADQEEEGTDEIKPEESPPLPPDLNKVSEEIDQYITSLSASKEDDDQSTNPPDDLPIFVEQFINLVEAKIESYDSGDSPVKWSVLTEEDSSFFLETVTRVSSLSKALSQFSSEEKYAKTINSIGGVLQRAMSYIEEEFKFLLEDYNINDADQSSNAKLKQSKSSISKQDSESQNTTTEPEPSPPEETNINIPGGYSEETLSNLIKLSKAMINGGYEAECCQEYFVVRRNALEESMHKLGFEKYSIDDVHKMQWENLEREIEAWIKTFKQCATIHLSAEKSLCRAVFSDHPSISESLFGSLSQGLTIQLLNFAEAVALTKRAAEKLFKFLDIYEALRDILSEMDGLFADDEWVKEVKTEGTLIRSRLGETMISIFSEIEHSIKSDAGKNTVPGGAVHPLTKYTMNYLEYACEYKETLEQVFREHQKIERADSEPRSDFDHNAHQITQQNVTHDHKVKQSPFQAQVAKVMDLLDANIEGKANLYKDHSLSSIFMMNNGRYILKKIRGSKEINGLMGDTWYRKKSSDLRHYHKTYQRETWRKLLDFLTPEGLTVSGKVSKPLLKERFKGFNAMFDEIHKTQSNWVVGDEQLQSELRVSISQMVIPAYRSFLGRYVQVFTPGRQTEKYVKFQPEDIETYIDDLFDGNARKKT